MSELEIRITSFSPEQLDAGAEIFRAVFNGPPWNDDWSFETARKRLSDILRTPGFQGWAATEDGLVGFLIGNLEQRCQRLSYCLQEMCVRSGLQRQGIGTRLLDQAKSELAALGTEDLYLLTMAGGPAADFYAKNNFWSNRRHIVMSHRL